MLKAPFYLVHPRFVIAGKYSSKLAIVEEEQCEDLLLFVELLGHHSAIQEELGGAEDLLPVLADGVRLLLSLINEELLKVCCMMGHIYTTWYSCLCYIIVAIVTTLSIFNLCSSQLSVKRSSMCSVASAYFLQLL